MKNMFISPRPATPPSCVFLFHNTEQLFFSQPHFPMDRIHATGLHSDVSTFHSYIPLLLLHCSLSILLLARIFLQCVISVVPDPAWYLGYMLGVLLTFLSIIHQTGIAIVTEPQ